MMRGKYHLLVLPALLAASAVLAFARGTSWQYLSLAGLFILIMADALRAELPQAVSIVRRPALCARGMQTAADLVFIRALFLAMNDAPVRHMRTPGAPFGAELVPFLVPLFMLCGALVWLWWIMRAVRPKEDKGFMLSVLLSRSALCGAAFSAAFLGGTVRPACALGAFMMLVSSSLSSVLESADHYHIEKGLGDVLVWTMHLAGVCLFAVGISLLN